MVYLIHFEKKLHHAQHYIGYAESSIEKRFLRHKQGNGAKILKCLNEKNIDYMIVKIWEDGDRTFERKLKKNKNSKRLCPICNPNYGGKYDK